MKPRIRRRWPSLGIALLAMLLLVQSVVAVLPGDVESASTMAATASGPTMPCDHGVGDCCDGDTPPSAPCDQMDSCASGDCALRAIASLPVLALVIVPALPPTGRIPADAPRWLLTRHDTPLLRPPISA